MNGNTFFFNDIKETPPLDYGYFFEEMKIKLEIIKAVIKACERQVILILISLSMNSKIVDIDSFLIFLSMVSGDITLIKMV